MKRAISEPSCEPTAKRGKATLFPPPEWDSVESALTAAESGDSGGSGGAPALALDDVTTVERFIAQHLSGYKVSEDARKVEEARVKAQMSPAIAKAYVMGMFNERIARDNIEEKMRAVLCGLGALDVPGSDVRPLLNAVSEFMTLSEAFGKAIFDRAMVTSAKSTHEAMLKVFFRTPVRYAAVLKVREAILDEVTGGERDPLESELSLASAATNSAVLRALAGLVGENCYIYDVDTGARQHLLDERVDPKELEDHLDGLMALDPSEFAVNDEDYEEPTKP